MPNLARQLLEAVMITLMTIFLFGTVLLVAENQLEEIAHIERV